MHISTVQLCDVLVRQWSFMKDHRLIKSSYIVTYTTDQWSPSERSGSHVAAARMCFTCGVVICRQPS